MNTSRRASTRQDDGFTLIETLIAMVILSVGLIAIANLMVVAATSNTVANQSTAATAVASETMERLKTLRFVDGGLAAGGDLDSDNTYFSDTDVPGVGVIHCRWQITDIDATTKFIAVRAEGTGALAQARSRAEFTTVRVQNPDPANPVT